MPDTRGIIKIMFTVIGFLTMLFGVSFFGLAIILGWRKWGRLRRFTKTTGVVVQVERQADHFDDRSSTLYRPTVRFQTADGRVVDHAPATSNNIPSSVGQSIEVHYDPHQPTDALIGGGFRLWFNLLVLGFAGIVFFIVGLFFVVISLAFAF